MIVDSIIKLVKNTHRHKANQALHCFGVSFYAVGLFMIIYHFIVSTQIHLSAGIAIWLSAIAMFITGHKIEGNISAITPVIVARLISRKIANYFFTHRIHFTRT